MNQSEIALSGFLSGVATAYFALQAYQLFRQKDSSRLQIVVAMIFVQWALFNLKDFFFTINDYNNKTVQDLLTRKPAFPVHSVLQESYHCRPSTEGEEPQSEELHEKLEIYIVFDL